MTSKDTPNAISSPGADSGQSQPDLLDGLTTNQFGPPLAPASRFRRPAKGAEPMIQGICGRTYFASGVPDGPLSEWESRLRERLAMVGSTESALIWREKVTPAGQSISRLAVSTRHTNGTGNIGSHWRTPIASNKGGGDTHTVAQIETMLERGQSIKLQDQMVQQVWSKPRASDGEKGGPNQSFGAGGQPLPAQMHQMDKAHWCTASARDWKDSAGMATQAGERSRLDQLPRQMVASAFHPTPLSLSFKDSHQPGTNRTIEKMRAYMPTPTVADIQGGRKTRSGKRSNEPLLNGIFTGPTPSGSPATTTKRGAPNPVFAFWLMGFPDEWIFGALEAMQSYRKPRKKS
jgi:hypothetical protein